MIVHSNSIPKNYEIAGALNVSVKTAENSFKKAYGTTIHQYILSKKIAKAKFQILNFPDIKLYEIAENLGFYNEFHLSKVFKKIVGVSPAQYKREKSQGKLS